MTEKSTGTSERSHLAIPKEIVTASNEKILMVLERTYISFVTIATVGLLVITGALLILNFTIPKENQWVMLPLAVFFFIILPPILYGLGYIYVKGHRYIITNERIIMFRKFIGILLRTVTHDKITDPHRESRTNW
ncbi:MAG: hypothetical protein QMD20_01785 [Candidatus Bathyarchaeia archaeon]|nr:hypothetical protein [Candidatus Bathyarchaeia archaeon]